MSKKFGFDKSWVIIKRKGVIFCQSKQRLPMWQTWFDRRFKNHWLSRFWSVWVV